MTGSFDPELNLIYWGTGNPAPDFNGEVRKGDNLYSDSVIAVDADSGKLKWHFQFTPHDVWDWDAVQIPVLVDAEFQGRARKLMLWPNRNAFYYVLDRETGEFLLAKPFAKQTWAKGIDKNGRPIAKPEMFPSEKGTLVYPAVTGAMNWRSPSYSPATRLLYVPALERANIFFVGEAEYFSGNTYYGSLYQPMADDLGWSAIKALVPQTGKVKWEYRLYQGIESGLLSTAGNLVFGGTERGTVLCSRRLNRTGVVAPRSRGSSHRRTHFLPQRAKTACHHCHRKYDLHLRTGQLNEASHPFHRPLVQAGLSTLKKTGVESRNYDQRQDGGEAQTKNNGHRHGHKKGILQQRQHTQHGGQGCHGYRPGTADSGLNDRLIGVHAFP